MKRKAIKKIFKKASNISHGNPHWLMNMPNYPNLPHVLTDESFFNTKGRGKTVKADEQSRQYETFETWVTETLQWQNYEIEVLKSVLLKMNEDQVSLENDFLNRKKKDKQRFQSYFDSFSADLKEIHVQQMEQSKILIKLARFWLDDSSIDSLKDIKLVLRKAKHFNHYQKPYTPWIEGGE